ncbi:MAG: DUF1553 domain-containing protein [Planctomycetales bacterium]|nr:DUF1553 domain-containing protein [Planctomycetales bacterium]
MSRRLYHASLFILVAVAGVGHTAADDEIDFARDVAPIFQARCIECHGPDEQQCGVRFDQRASLLRESDNGNVAIVPGKPDASHLLHVVRSHDEDVRMPPEGERLTDQETDTLRRWIELDATWPGQMDAAAKSDHWSFQPLQSITPPSQPEDTSPIDRFIIRRLQKANLKMSAPAEPITLLRRVSFVITGLPPDAEEVDRVLQSPKGFEKAYADYVDTLIDSPRYGERWAQHWLDVIRWAETVGFETNLERPNAWPYRDWVIKSLNDDKPYNLFLFEQLAGDTVGQDAALGFLVAGPANLPGQIGRDEEAMRQARQDELDEVIRTVSQACFGLTIGCARCHNHKFDPILQRDYYSMQAVFAGLQYGDRRWRGEQNDAWTAQLPRIRTELADGKERLAEFTKQLELADPVADLQTETFPAVRATAVRMTIIATASGGSASLYELEVWSRANGENEPSRNVALASSGATPSASSFALENQTRHFDNLIDGSRDRRQAFPWIASQSGEAWVQIEFSEPALVDRIVIDRGSSVPVDYKIELRSEGSDDWTLVADTSRRALRIDDIRPADRVTIKGLSKDQTAKLAELTAEVRRLETEQHRLSTGPQVYAASFNPDPPKTWLLRRGDPMQRAAEVFATVPDVLQTGNEAKPSSEVERRILLAKHLTSDNHPLTSRVIVNRIWQHHFGTGIVDSPSDFGKMGAAPSHPELLDWLAFDFVSNGWSLKRLHRAIVLSRAFRQSSQAQTHAMEIDAEARLLWRFPPRRLEAEAIRDTVLCVSGKLNLAMGGRGFDFFQQRGGLSDYLPIETFDESGWRRMIYAHKIRMQSVDIFGVFDCPDAGQMKPKRTRSITPLQSLSLMNSPFSVRQSEFFAGRIRATCESQAPEELVQAAFRLAFTRHPSEEEESHSMKFVEKHGLAAFCRVLMNTSEFVYIR